MARTMTVEGAEELSKALEQCAEAAQGIAALSLYDGAGVIADAVRAGMDSVNTAPFKYVKNGVRLPSPEEKAILEQVGIGIAKYEKNGSEVKTVVGFNQSDYVNVSWNHMSNSARTNYKEMHIKGHDQIPSSVAKAIGENKGKGNMKPAAVIANAINSGTSFMKKQPFFRKAVNSSSAKAQAAMTAKGEELLDKILKD